MEISHLPRGGMVDKRKAKTMLLQLKQQSNDQGGATVVAFDLVLHVASSGYLGYYSQHGAAKGSSRNE